MPENPRYIRWQAASMAQLGYANNLILALAIASLGFALKGLDDQAFAAASSCSRWSMFLSVAALLVSPVAGLACVLNRLQDFRKTAKIARGIMTGEEEEAARSEVRGLGDRTWLLFYWQVGMFGTGVVLIVLSLALRI